jgi:hypothetical protein
MPRVRKRRRLTLPQRLERARVRIEKIEERIDTLENVYAGMQNVSERLRLLLLIRAQQTGLFECLSRRQQLLRRLVMSAKRKRTVTVVKDGDAGGRAALTVTAAAAAAPAVVVPPRHKRNFRNFIVDRRDPESVGDVRQADAARFRAFMNACLEDIPDEGEPSDGYAYNAHMGAFARALSEAMHHLTAARVAFAFVRE